ncbi:MAG: hypothetical protein KIT09_10110 [Bryobacteraceae bacterium]|nr:hypothetical protein [Bryobacteraceae bacterium]
MQHINVKIFAQQPIMIDIGQAIPIFHRWIQDRATDELLVDVADYRHVPEGPGVMLIGHQANYSMDNAGGRLGLLYNRKLSDNGSIQERLRQAYDSALAACKRLEDEPEFRHKLKFHPGDCEVIFNDRLLAPNDEQTYQTLKPELELFFGSLWGHGAFDLGKKGEPRERLRVRAALRSVSLPAV